MLRYTDVLHSRITVVYSILFVTRFAANVGDQNCELAKNVSLENGSIQIDYDHKNNFWQLFWAHFVASDN